MKYILTLVFIFSLAYGQTIGSTPIAELDSKYLSITGTRNLLTGKTTILIDFGQNKKQTTVKDSQLKGKDGKNIQFNSIVDALNFLDKNGYQYIDSYIVTYQGQNVYHYILRRKEESSY